MRASESGRKPEVGYDGVGLAHLIKEQRPETRDQRSEIRDQRPEIKDRRSETRDQRSEIRDQRPEIKDRRSETRDQRSGTRDQRSETRDQRPEIKDQRSEIKDQRSKTGDQRPEIKDQRSGTRDQRSEIRDQRPEIRDRRSEITDQRIPVIGVTFNCSVQLTGMKFKEDITSAKAFEFAVKIVEETKNISRENKEFVMTKQLLRSGTSIGANVAESKGAISKADYSAKVSIAYKECLEAKFWLRLLRRTNYLTQERFEELFNHADELGRILYSTLRTTRGK